MRTVIRIWHVIGEYQIKSNTNTTVAFRVRTTATADRSGKRTAVRYVKESPQARMLKLKNIRTAGIEGEPCGIISWDAPGIVKRKFSRLYGIETKKVIDWVAAELKTRLKKRRKKA